MGNPTLNSESFERAAYCLQQEMERFRNSSPLNFDVGRFEQSVNMFRESVNKLSTILGMQAENDHRKSLGQSVAYIELDFFKQ